MTHEQFITLETAKLAKQAGFDWECLARYSQEGELKMQGDLDFNLLCFDWNGLEPVDYVDFGIVSAYGSISAPTQAMLQRWLREVKKYQVTIFLNPRVIEEDGYDPRYEFDPNRYGYHIENLNDRGCTEGEDYDYMGYEVALEAGLQKCLTLIIKKQ